MSRGHAQPALAYCFDTPDGAVVSSGDTTMNDDRIALAQAADILVHMFADLDYLERHGFAGPALQRMSALRTDVTGVGGVAERARFENSLSSLFAISTRCGHRYRMDGPGWK